MPSEPEPLSAASLDAIRKNTPDDDGLQWSNHTVRRLLATIDAVRAMSPDLDGHGATLDAIVDELAGLAPSLRTRIPIEEAIAAVRSRWSIETRHVELDRAVSPDLTGALSAAITKYTDDLCAAGGSTRQAVIRTIVRAALASEPVPATGNPEEIFTATLDSQRTQEDIIRRRQSYLAYLFLNLETCPACHLPKAEGYTCPCGVDE